MCVLPVRQQRAFACENYTAFFAIKMITAHVFFYDCQSQKGRHMTPVLALMQL